jgi:hypothetical protein
MRRTHLRGHKNVLKRQLIHVGAFNLSLILLQADRRGHARVFPRKTNLRPFSWCVLTAVGGHEELGRKEPNMMTRRRSRDVGLHASM